LSDSDFSSSDTTDASVPKPSTIKKPEEITEKKCGLCDVIIKGENSKDVSKNMAKHLEKSHP